MHKGPFPFKTLVFLTLLTVFILVPQTLAQSSPPAQEKITPDLQAALTDLPEGEMITFIVTLIDQADLSQIPGASRAARQQGIIRALQAQARASQAQIMALLNAWQNQGKVENYDSFWVFNGLSVTATQEVIQNLAARSDVLKITPDDISISPTFIQSAAPPEDNISNIMAPALWDLGFYGQGVVVANMDSGVDFSHPELFSRWRGGSNSWFDPFGQHATTPTDLTGHGTQTMGIMVGGENGGTAIGVAPQAQWIAVKIFNDAGSSTATAVHQGYQWLMDPDGNPATADTPHVVNNSWTMAYPGCDLEFELDLASLRAMGILPVFAAGNGGPSSGTSYSPANNPSAFAVGAVDNNDQIYGYSSRGLSACDQTTFPDVVAPGVNIRTADLYETYTTASGTSLAAPHVSGGLALLFTAFQDLSSSLQEAALVSAAFDLGASGSDNDFGHGRLDLLSSYDWLLANPEPPAPPPPAPDVNLAMNQPVSVSSSQDAGHDGAAAVDGDLATSWQTAKASGKNKLPSEWIQIDLGAVQVVDKVVLQWDASYATNYSIQVSTDGANWTTVHTTTSGNGGEDNITFTAAAARYVKMDSTSWLSDTRRNWLREFEVYYMGDGSTEPPPPPPPPEPGNSTAVHVGALDASTSVGSRNRWDVSLTITVHDASESAVSGATVVGTWSDGATGSGTCETNGSGTCTLNKNNIKGNISSVSFFVNAITGLDLEYDPDANHDPGNDGGITVSRP
jgi:subtilisin family serine protease